MLRLELSTESTLIANEMQMKSKEMLLRETSWALLVKPRLHKSPHDPSPAAGSESRNGAGLDNAVWDFSTCDPIRMEL